MGEPQTTSRREGSKQPTGTRQETRGTRHRTRLQEEADNVRDWWSHRQQLPLRDTHRISPRSLSPAQPRGREPAASSRPRRPFGPVVAERTARHASPPPSPAEITLVRSVGGSSVATGAAILKSTRPAWFRPPSVGLERDTLPPRPTIFPVGRTIAAGRTQSLRQQA